MSSPTNDAGSGYRLPTMAGRGRSQSVSSTDSQPRLSRSRSISALSQTKIGLDENSAIASHERPDESSEVTASLNPADAPENNDNAGVSIATTMGFQSMKLAGTTNSVGKVNNPEAGESFKSAKSEFANVEGSVAAKVENFFKIQWTNPAQELKDTITIIASAPGTTRSFDDVAQEFIAAAVLITNEFITEDAKQPAYPQANIKALKDLGAKYPDPTDPTAPNYTAQPSLPEEERNIRLRMMEHGDSSQQSLLTGTILLINGTIAGDSGEHALKKICPPPKKQMKTLIFQTSCLYPKDNFTYVIITISRWATNVDKGGKHLNKVGTILVPMILCQDQEPKLDTLSKIEAANFLGVDECTVEAARYTVIGYPRFHNANEAAHPWKDSIRQGQDSLHEIIQVLNQGMKVKIDLVHPIYEQTDDLSCDPTVRILEKCTEGWHRDANKPLSSYFTQSSSKRLLDLGTVDQLPALDVFDPKEQCDAVNAIGKQQDKEYHDRQRVKLHEFDVPARFFLDRRCLQHPRSKAPQEYFMVFNTLFAGANNRSLLPQIGDFAEIVLEGISIKQQAPQDMVDPDNERIATHIKDSIWDVVDDTSLESHSASDEKLQGLLKILCIRDENGNDISANLEKLQSNLEEIQQVELDDQELSEFVKSNRSWLAPPPLKVDELNVFSDPVHLHAHRISPPKELWPAPLQLWKLQVPIDKATGSAKLPLILDLPDPSVDNAGNFPNTMDFLKRPDKSDAYVNVKIRIIHRDKPTRQQRIPWSPRQQFEPWHWRAR